MAVVDTSYTEIPTSNVVLFAFIILLVFFALCAAFWIGWRYSQKGASLSPYSGMPLRRGSDLSYYNIERVLRYIYTLQDYNNRIFLLRNSAFCRETGRIFPDCINWFDNINVDWTFLQKRYPGSFVSWGSLSKDQQDAVRDVHESLEGFQTEFSSKEPMPKAVEPEFAFLKPGPLYVDINSYVLLGWKIVPGTNLEVLIVQRPTHKRQAYFTPIIED